MVTVLKNKINDIENEVEKNTNTNNTVISEPEVTNTKNTSVKNDYSTNLDYSIKTPIVNNNPFLQVLIYAAISALITGIIVAIFK